MWYEYTHTRSTHRYLSKSGEHIITLAESRYHFIRRRCYPPDQYAGRPASQRRATQGVARALSHMDWRRPHSAPHAGRPVRARCSSFAPISQKPRRRDADAIRTRIRIYALLYTTLYYYYCYIFLYVVRQIRIYYDYEYPQLYTNHIIIITIMLN